MLQISSIVEQLFLQKYSVRCEQQVEWICYNSISNHSYIAGFESQRIELNQGLTRNCQCALDGVCDTNKYSWVFILFHNKTFFQ